MAMIFLQSHLKLLVTELGGGCHFWCPFSSLLALAVRLCPPNTVTGPHPPQAPPSLHHGQAATETGQYPESCPPRAAAAALLHLAGVHIPHKGHPQSAWLWWSGEIALLGHKEQHLHKNAYSRMRERAILPNTCRQTRGEIDK